MSKRTFVTKSGDTWEWEESKETKKALAQYWAGDYQGPLYAPHPNIVKEQDDKLNYDTSGK